MELKTPLYEAHVKAAERSCRLPDIYSRSNTEQA